MFREYPLWIPIVLLPSLLFLLYGVLAKHTGTPSNYEVFRSFAAMITVESMASGIFSIGVGISADRQGGVLRLKRLYPLPPGTYMVYKILSRMLLFYMSIFLLSLLLLASGWTPSFSDWVEAVIYAVLGVAPFSALGLTIGLFSGSVSAASGIANIVLMFLGFVSGVFISLHSLPGFLQRMSIIWPCHQVYILCYTAISGNQNRNAIILHLSILSLETIALFLIVGYKWRRLPL
ncbi:ABC transporter permease [Acidithiobacillus acidisediminis]|uniref:ABC transporter permease n=1 Tax=Acidithiobacillus acidisediminis TaxID=2937799 RepID=UPI003D67085A